MGGERETGKEEGCSGGRERETDKEEGCSGGERETDKEEGCSMRERERERERLARRKNVVGKWEMANQTEDW